MHDAIPVVDALRLLVCMSLQAPGKIATAETAQQALAHIRAVPTRLVALDVWPGAGQSGLELCRKPVSGLPFVHKPCNYDQTAGCTLRPGRRSLS